MWDKIKELLVPSGYSLIVSAIVSVFAWALLSYNAEGIVFMWKVVEVISFIIFGFYTGAVLLECLDKNSEKYPKIIAAITGICAVIFLFKYIL